MTRSPNANERASAEQAGAGKHNKAHSTHITRCASRTTNDESRQSHVLKPESKVQQGGSRSVRVSPQSRLDRRKAHNPRTRTPRPHSEHPLPRLPQIIHPPPHDHCGDAARACEDGCPRTYDCGSALYGPRSPAPEPEPGPAIHGGGGTGAPCALCGADPGGIIWCWC